MLPRAWDETESVTALFGKSRLKISSEAEASNESLIAPATVPAAMYEAVSCVGPQATVAPRRMYEIRSFMTRCD